MPDIITLIEADHAELEEVFTSIEAADGDIKPLLERVAELLIPHSKAEEEVVYPAIKKIAPDEKDDVNDSLEEHRHIEEMLQEALEQGPETPGVDGVIAAIIGEVRHHVDEEEHEILPTFAKKASATQLDEIGAQFAEAKQTALEKFRQG